MMPGSYSSMHCFSRPICLYHVSAHSPTCLRRYSSRQARADPIVLVLCCSVVNHARIYGAFQDVHGTREPGCDKRGVNDTIDKVTRRDWQRDRISKSSVFREAWSWR